MAVSEQEHNITQPPQSRHLGIVILFLLLALAAAVRLPGINRPLLGNFATKQAIYGMIARNWVLGRAELAYPTLDVLQGGHRALQMVEMPVSVYATATGWWMFGGPLDVWGRATAVVLSLGSIVLLYDFVRRRHSRSAAAAAALALALSPVSIIYGRSFMLQASLVFFTLTTFVALDRWLATRDGRSARWGFLWLLAAGIGMALLLLTKIYMVVLLLPLGLMCLRPGVATRRRILAAVVLGLAVLPAAWWYALAYRTAEPGGPLAERVFYSVRFSVEAHRPPHPLLFSADFYRGVFDDLSGVVLTPLGFALALAGLLDRRWRRYAGWLAVSALLLVALPRKFHEMNYYWMAVLPPLCILVGLGWETIHRRLGLGRVAMGAVVLVALVASIRYTAKPAFLTPREDRGVVPAAAALDKLADDDEPVVTMHGTSLDLLYYCNRPGWFISAQDKNLAQRLDACRRQGARFVVLAGAETLELGEPVVEGETFRIYRLCERNP